MNIKIEIDGAMMRQLVIAHMADALGDVPLKPDDVVIEVKSKNNYKSEWETADFRASLLVVTK